MAGFIPKPDDSWPTWLVVTYWIVMALFGLGLLAVMIIKTFKFMKKGRAGILIRRGDPVLRNGDYVYKGPGIHPMIPFLDSIEDLSVLQDTTDMPAFLAERSRVNDSKEKIQFIIDARPAWRVENSAKAIHDALFVADSPEKSVVRILTKTFNRAVESAEDPYDKELIESVVASDSKAQLAEIGVILDDPGLMSVSRTPVQALGELIGQAHGNAGVNPVQLGAAAGVSLELVQS